eukprot:c16021_g1_i1.p1 GENE.c16021_g1_i1~~c16021_g1_i1.p1  ORF type:complete len:159 (+),score=59.18 c16021_g1_i1:66-542(+)
MNIIPVRRAIVNYQNHFFIISRLAHNVRNLTEADLEFRFSRSSGPGGQNVNKVNTKVEARLCISTANWLPAEVKERLREICKNKVNSEDELIITSQAYRTQEQNREDAFTKMNELIQEAAIPPKERNIREGLTEQAKENRLKQKKALAAKKSHRRDDF